MIGASDHLVGDGSRNVIKGNDGFDTIEGRQGHDHILGGPDDDHERRAGIHDVDPIDHAASDDDPPTHDDVHVDYHAIAFDPEDPEHLIVGNDGGVGISFDQDKR